MLYCALLCFTVLCRALPCFVLLFACLVLFPSHLILKGKFHEQSAIEEKFESDFSEYIKDASKDFARPGFAFLVIFYFGPY